MESFIKWAGGKRWFIKNYNHLIPKSDQFNRYFEPFLGGGSMFFYLKPKKAFLNDINNELIITYEQIRDNWETINSNLIDLNERHNETLYYNIRAQKPNIDIEIAIRFLYLNRTCWNGLYRVNANNEFNVPIGTKTRVVLDNDNFELRSKLLKNVKFSSNDFEVLINKARKDDFVFIDPPYTVKHNNNGFIKYNEILFKWEDQVRLKNCVVKAVNRGVKILILNANHESIRALYHNIGEFHFLTRKSVISGKKEFRGTYEELAIKCY